MTTRSDSAKRKSSTKKNTNGIKALIMAASLGITLGGWGILATGQTQTAQASSQPAQVIVPTTNSTTQSSGGTNSSRISSRSNASSAAVSPLARTRSSR